MTNPLEPKPPEVKPPVNPKKAMIINVCAIVGLVIALVSMFAVGISGAIPGALFGGIGGGLGGLIGMGIASLVVRE